MSPEPVICSLFLFLSGVLFWLASTTVINLEKKNLYAYFSIGVLTLTSLLFAFFSWIGQENLLSISRFPFRIFYPAIFLLILIPYGWYFIIAWFLGLLQGRTFYKVLAYVLGISQIFACILIFIKGSNYGWEVSIYDFWISIPISFRSSYIIYVFLCVILSLVGLLNFKVTSRVFTEIARYRSVPYLKAVCILLLAVIGCVSLLFLGESLGIAPDPVVLSLSNPNPLYVYLILIEILVTIAILLLGQTLVSYEFLTGRILPQIGLKKEWRIVLLLAGSVSVVYIVFSLLGYRVAEILLASNYSFLLSRMFALRQSKRSNFRRNESLQSVLFFESLPESRTVFEEKFDFVCQRILNSSKSLLVSETSSPFLSKIILSYPNVEETYEPKLQHRVFDPERSIFYMSGEDSFEYSIAVGIEETNGIKGTLFLGPKLDGGLYAEEEIELAKTATLWILNGILQLETNQTLSELQRKHIREQRISDHKTRQILHDEILPELHSGILNLNENSGREKIKEHLRSLTELHGKISGFLRELPDIRSELARIGMIPVFQNLLDSDFSKENIIRNIEPGFPELADKLPPDLQEAVYYSFREALRNAIKFSSSSKEAISLSFFQKSGLRIEIKNAVRPNSESESTGQGLKIHSALLKIFGAGLNLEFQDKKIAIVNITIPIP
ncbi:hypothetical protein CH371_15945 [Leptospira wolffii]|uniref:ATP-binding protein n=1 Tax=Leptospira wolffii TaxID=409998 RepID=A0A2M9Z977_9LEPT|nr:ATP-binding protein [Leptospira wolffii]PJZ64991.1 hypothetical protein CH371_15945 [Leptospira wolffii]